ncbi:MAG: TlpA family protein disulfide reductase, partial [Armatimonadetes bacterium]|nr:TlpA family protein disulfide reductase [Armatimonadota bacterium]
MQKKGWERAMRIMGFCIAWLLLVTQFPMALEVENLLGQRAPDFALLDLNSKMVKLSQFQGKVVVLVFWAFWCDTWKETSDTLKLIRERFPPSSVQILCVAVDPSWKEIGQRMRRRTNGSFPILLDRGGQVSKIYG